MRLAKASVSPNGPHFPFPVVSTREREFDIVTLVVDTGKRENSQRGPSRSCESVNSIRQLSRYALFLRKIGCATERFLHLFLLFFLTHTAAV
jgi:hypothetical protein